MLRRRIDGMIIIPAPHSDGYLRGGEFSRVHVVTMDRPAPDTRFDSVVVNNRGGTRAGVTHLIEHGHQRIAFVGLNKALCTMQARYSGYRDAITKARVTAGCFVAC